MSIEQMRPRLTRSEIQFIVWALTEYKEHIERKSAEVKQLEWRVHLLRKELWVNPMVYKELNAVKKQLAQEKAKHYTRYQTVCDYLLRRFKGMFDGRMLHTPFWVLQQLNQITSKQ